jgi:hypothetical protein
MKPSYRASLPLALTFALLHLLFEPPAVTGHDGWAEPVPALIEKGQIASIALIQGNHSNEHKSFRIAGKWNPQYTRLWVIDPAGKTVDLSSRLIDMGEDEEKIGPKGPKGFYLASWQAESGGIYRILARQERVLQHGQGPKFRSIRTATTALASLGVPTTAAARKLKWFDNPIGRDDALEIVPTKNLLGIQEGEPVVLQVRYKGKPARDKVVTVVRKIDGPPSARDLVTNPEGLVYFMAGPADHYLLRVKFDEQSEASAGQYEKSTYEATYVFQVFHRR